jgi:hypothetical protein
MKLIRKREIMSGNYAASRAWVSSGLKSIAGPFGTILVGSIVI